MGIITVQMSEVCMLTECKTHSKIYRGINPDYLSQGRG